MPDHVPVPYIVPRRSMPTGGERLVASVAFFFGHRGVSSEGVIENLMQLSVLLILSGSPTVKQSAMFTNPKVLAANKGVVELVISALLF